MSVFNIDEELKSLLKNEDEDHILEFSADISLVFGAKSMGDVLSAAFTLAEELSS